MSEALARAKKDRKPVEVVGQRQAASTTFANPDGTMSVSLSQRPTRAEKAGEWVPIDTTLVKNAKGRLEPRATSSKVTLRATASSTSLSTSTKELAPAEPGAEPNAPTADVEPGVETGRPTTWRFWIRLVRRRSRWGSGLICPRRP